MAEQEGRWVTMRGRRVFIKDGESVSDAINRSIAKSNDDTKEKQITTGKINQERLNSSDGMSKTAITNYQNKISEILDKHHDGTRDGFDKACIEIGKYEQAAIKDGILTQHEAVAGYESYKYPKELSDKIKERTKQKESKYQLFNKAKAEKDVDEDDVSDRMNDFVYNYGDGGKSSYILLSGKTPEVHRVVDYEMGKNRVYYQDGNTVDSMPVDDVYFDSELDQYAKDMKISVSAVNNYLKKNNISLTNNINKAAQRSFSRSDGARLTKKESDSGHNASQKLKNFYNDEYRDGNYRYR